MVGAQAARHPEERQQLPGQLHNRGGTAGGEPPGTQQPRVLQLLWGKTKAMTPTLPGVAAKIYSGKSCFPLMP